MPEYVRVLDKDTGHKRSVPSSEVPHGNYEVLAAEPAVNPATLEPLPVELAKPAKTAAPESLSSKSTSGQSADPKKENAHG